MCTCWRQSVRHWPWLLSLRFASSSTFCSPFITSRTRSRSITGLELSLCSEERLSLWTFSARLKKHSRLKRRKRWNKVNWERFPGVRSGRFRRQSWFYRLIASYRDFLSFFFFFFFFFLRMMSVVVVYEAHGGNFPFRIRSISRRCHLYQSMPFRTTVALIPAHTRGNGWAKSPARPLDQLFPHVCA